MTTGKDFEGQVAVVTGAGSGIGAATARLLVERGAAAVYLCDINAAAAEEVAGSIEGGTGIGLDVSNPDEVDAAFGRVLAEKGRIDVVVHAAGVDDPQSKQKIYEAAGRKEPVDILSQLSNDSWRRIISVNLDGTFFVLRAAVRAMKPQGAGSIVTIGSSAAFDTLTGYPHYAASKAGVHALSQAAAKEVAPFGIRINTVAPGPVDTGMASRTPSALREAMSDAGARGFATARELADNILYLASPGAANVIGAVLLSNGGRFTV
ncbi:SDR family NAD(P)-dependent oxidoreductase [Arthrobacter gengyunqii]|uniref:SDR family oxidoreductase n=1 Tax=Arthrobacter gengyunqii TaxID=2886940 RepID=A0ABS8GFZ9_9MICC|nr:SDR family NAD(P)-dependent oxidoreductase [Arthrobacter gengyunqii]MCC3265500.1 SDR family oxidoreductase [Arthrobacter gengyunqii]